VNQIVAIYARKSTDQSDAGEAKSVTRQIEQLIGTMHLAAGSCPRNHAKNEGRAIRPCDA